MYTADTTAHRSCNTEMECTTTAQHYRTGNRTESVSLTEREETRQGTNVTLRALRVTSVASKSKYYYKF
jgi:hypothetical protein